MSVSYFVRYEGDAADQVAFLNYYRDHHARILAHMPEIERVVLHTPVEWQDPFPVKADRFLLVAQMVFPSREALQRALESDARAEARMDFAKFPPFTGAVFHQAAMSEEVFCR